MQINFSRINKGGVWILFSAVIGMTSMAFQTASIKVLFNFFAQSTIVTSIAISTYLVGLVIGNWIVTRINVSPKELHAVALMAVGLTQMLMVFYALGLLQNTGVIWGILALKKTLPLIGYVVIFLYLLPIGLLTGICFPLLAGCYLHSSDGAGEESVFHKPTARILAWDTLGSIAGCLASGVWLIPVFGLALTLQIASGVAWLTASVAIIFYHRRLLYGGLLAAAGISIIIWLGISAWYQRADLEKTVYFTPHSDGRERLLFQKESPFGTVRVTTDLGGQETRRLFINLRTMIHSQFSNSEKALAILAMDQINKTYPSGEIRVLNIGLGGGLTAGELLKNPGVKLTISEINPVIVEAAKKYFKELNRGVLEPENKSRVEVRIENGLETLRNSPDHYWHAIIIDVEEPTIIYSSGLYTLEAFQLIAKKLMPNGVMGFWAFSKFDGFVKVLYNTIEPVFQNILLRFIPGILLPNVDISNDMYYYVFFGSQGSLEEISRTISSREMALIGGIKQLPIYEINTLKKSVLEKYFKINEWYGLPADYTEKFYGDLKEELIR